MWTCLLYSSWPYLNAVGCTVIPKPDGTSSVNPLQIHYDGVNDVLYTVSDYLIGKSNRQGVATMPPEFTAYPKVPELDPGSTISYEGEYPSLYRIPIKIKVVWSALGTPL